MNARDAQRYAARIASEIMTSGDLTPAARLSLETKDGVVLSRWTQPPLARRIESILKTEPDARKAVERG